MYRKTAVVVAAALAFGACSSQKESSPARTATEQLLISTAADRATDNLELSIPAGARVFVNAEQFEGTDSKYAVAAIRDRLLREGIALVPERGQADAVVELRAGALSIDENNVLVGIPSYNVPVPLAPAALTLPEIALFKRTERKGVAKVGATSYGTADGRLIDSAEPRFGYAHKREYRVLLFFSWRTSDLPQETTNRPPDEW